MAERATVPGRLSQAEAGLEPELADLFAVADQSAAEQSDPVAIDEGRVAEAYRFAVEHHAEQRRQSGERFISHPLSVARICAGLGLDTETLMAALLHDTVEDTTVTLDQVRERFGEEVAALVDGLTKIDSLTFNSRDEAQAENYRKMLVAMASDIRVIIIKLADRLHNMRTIGALSKQKQIEKSRETLEIYAPLAHRLGIHTVKWELEDLAFATLHPRKYQEIKALVSQQRDDRERYVAEAGAELAAELGRLGIDAEISGRAKHFYSIYSKMTRKGREFNEIYDLTAMRVLVDSVKDCYGAVGAIHSLWKPLPGRFKDMIAMPKFNLYQSLHTTVIGPGGRPLEIQIRTHEMHRTAEYGVAAHWSYKSSASSPNELEKDAWLRSMLEWQQGVSDPGEFVEDFKGDLFDKEVFVFTPKGEVRSLAAGATPLDFAYSIHTDLGHRCVGAKVNGRIVPLGYELRSGDRVEVLTGRRERGPSRDWLAMVKTTRARNKIKQWFKAEGREDAERTGRELLQNELRDAGLPPQKITGSPLLAGVVREMGFRRTEDFYVALGGAKISPAVVVTKVLQSLKEGKAAEGDREEKAVETSRPASRTPRATSEEFGIHVEGVDRVMLRLARCCHPVPGDPIVGYVSLGRGITIHRDDCRNVAALRRDPNRFVAVRWEGEHETAFQAEIHIDAWDRHRLLEDLTRTIAEQGVNIVEVRCLDQRPMVSDRFVVEVGDTRTLKSTIARLRQVEGVFDAYRVTPSA
jgi:guanosine-3',5'-bis(diphosphate) 3'-pyrophosphohydrolase